MACAPRQRQPPGSSRLAISASPCGPAEAASAGGEVACTSAT